MKDLPNGLLYEGDRGQIENMFREEGMLDSAVIDGAVEDEAKTKGLRKRYPGGSAAQSSLIHSLDSFLGVRHRATGAPVKSTPEADVAAKRVNFLKEMRYHIPKRHRAWLRSLEELPSLREFINHYATQGQHEEVYYHHPNVYLTVI